MQGVTAGGHGEVDDAVDVEIAGDGIRTDVVGLVGFFYMQGMAVGLGIDGDRFDAHFRAGAHDAHGDFPAVGDQDFLDQVQPLAVGRTPAGVVVVGCARGWNP